MVLNAILALVVCTILGSLTLIIGGRLFHLTTRMLAVTFFVTATSWTMLIIALIGWTVRTLVFASV